MGYTPENNPYIPGDPYSYDMAWMVQEVKRAQQVGVNAQASADAALQSQIEAQQAKDLSMAWAIGEDDGGPIPPGEPQYENNAKYYAQQAGNSAQSASEDAESASLDAASAAASELSARNYAENIADPVSGIVTNWLDNHITQPSTPPIDTSLSVAGAAADAKATGDSIRAIQDELNKPISDLLFNNNIFDSSTVTTGKGLDPSGSEISAGVVCISDYIPVFPNTLYKVMKNLGSSSYAHCWYDSAKTFISSELSNVGASYAKYITAPANAAYLRISSLTSTVADQAVYQCSAVNNGIFYCFTTNDWQAIPDVSNLLNAIVLDGITQLRLYGEMRINDVYPAAYSKIHLEGVFRTTSATGMFIINGVNYVTIEGGRIYGDSSTDTQNGIVIIGGSNCIIKDVSVLSVKNKGVGISGSSKFNLISGIFCSGMSGTTGAGLSIYGDSAIENKIEAATVTNCRIGIALNGCKHNIIKGVNSYYNGCGICLDGIVSDSGDGAYYNVISDIITRQTSGTLGAIYLGNGANHNIVSNVDSYADTYGLRASSHPDHPVCYNKLIGFTIAENTTSAVSMSVSDQNSLIDFDIIDPKSYGVDIYGGSWNLLNAIHVTSHDNSNATGPVGIRLMTDYAVCSNCIIQGAKTGIYVVSGYPGKPPAGFILEGNYLVKNRYNYSTNAGIALGGTSKQIAL